MTTTMLRRWLTEDDGQDLIEYALLASFVGFTMAISVSLIRTAMHDTYESWDSMNQTDALVEVPDPQ
jgi:Flp pilus assembly pilin Flp